MGKRPFTMPSFFSAPRCEKVGPGQSCSEKKIEFELSSILASKIYSTEGATKAMFYCQVEKCAEEETSFTSKTGFIQHLETTHTDIKAWKCSYCDHRCKFSHTT